VERFFCLNYDFGDSFDFGDSLGLKEGCGGGGFFSALFGGKIWSKKWGGKILPILKS
jgi:hypothetical protein